MTWFIAFMFAIVVTEAVTELVVKSEVFKPLRSLVFNRGKKSLDFIHELLDCGYCTSVWMSLPISMIFIHMSFINPYVDWFVYWMVVHRGSNLLHHIIDRVKGDLN